MGWAIRDFNLKIAEEIQSEGGKVLFVKLKDMAHKISSRLVGVEVNAADAAHG